VLYGGPGGLGGKGAQFWTPDSPGVAESAAELDQFGYSLAAGDFDGDGTDDLVVGVLDEDIGDLGDAGGVNVLYGSKRGVTATGNQFWSQDSPGLADQSETGDEMGFAARAGDFDGDGFDDLAIGAAFESITVGGPVNPSDEQGAGAVTVLYGSARGLTAAGNQFWHQDSEGVEDAVESGDQFAYSLASADFNGDRKADLAVGAPGEGFQTEAPRAGAVHVLYGSRAGVTAAADGFFRQGAGGIPDSDEQDDTFGATVAG
jgi:hypothetical protein